MTKRSKLDSLVVSIRKSKRQGLTSLPAAKRKALVRERGSDAVRAILLADHPDWEAEVFELGEPASPWPYAGLNPGEVARRALGPLADRLPRLLAKLASAELVVPAHREAEPDSPDRGGWFLIYALPTDAGHELWIAGPPEAAPELEVEGWTLPEPLRELYAQHDGMGLLHAQFGWTGVQPGIQPSVQLAMPVLDTQDEDWAPEPADLLRFTQGSGELGESGWCFARNQKPRKGRRKPSDELVVCELDEFSVLGNAVPFDFWGFLDRYLVGDPEAELPALER